MQTPLATRQDMLVTPIERMLFSMKLHEFGDKSNPVILLMPGTMCYWKGNFDGAIETLSKDFFVAARSQRNGTFPIMISVSGTEA